MMEIATELAGGHGTSESIFILAQRERIEKVIHEAVSCYFNMLS